MGNRIIFKLVVSFALLVLFTVIIINFFVSLKLADHMEASITTRLLANARLLARHMVTDLRADNKAEMYYEIGEVWRTIGCRVTVIGLDGKVIVDTEYDTTGMEAHINRPEVIQALKTGYGKSKRFSRTLEYEMLYVAVPVRDEEGVFAIVRLSLPLSELVKGERDIYSTVLMGGGASVLLVMVLGYLISRSIIMPLMEMTEVAQAITAGDFSRRIKPRGSEELVILANALNHMSKRLEQKIIRLREADRMKTDLVGNVSHELKTPLTSIIGYIETLEDGAIEDRANARRFLSIIKKHAAGLAKTVNALLSLSEIEHGGAVLREEFDIRGLVEEAVAGFGYAASSRGQAIRVELSGDEFVCRGDRLKIGQAIVNMIDNALKYSHDGGEVTVRVLSGGGPVEIAVSDSGIGISAAHRERVFERFYRVDRARSRKLGGSGLGLAIVKNVARLHGGGVTIDSEPGKGTTITMWLPG